MVLSREEFGNLGNLGYFQTEKSAENRQLHVKYVNLLGEKGCFDVCYDRNFSAVIS